MRRSTTNVAFLTVSLMALVAATLVAETTLDVRLPLARTAYQTNETIDLAVLRRSSEPLAANDLVLMLTGDGGSQLRFVFAGKAVPVVGNEARATEHLHVNARLLRPSHYTVGVSADGASAEVEIDIYSHIRRSTFKIINWGGSGHNKGEKQLAAGEDSLGYNLVMGHYTNDNDANFIRAGVDFMSCCTMGGGHQMDLRADCDWSDPYVVRGGTRRVVRRAFVDRTRPNVPGVHFYDEPGLTWHHHPETGEWGPHNVPAQMRSYKSAFDRDAPQYHKVDPNDPEQVEHWKHWAYWKLGLMDAAWQDSQFGVSAVRPDFMSVTQSQYGYTAFTDGYYSNVVRSLPVVSGHGGYHDWGPGYFNPSMFLEFARPRNLAVPNWYLPAWYGNTSSDEFRLEQYLSFQTNIQGMASPPGLDPCDPSRLPAAPGVIESNKLMARLGTIFNTMPVTRPPVALLYSLSHRIEKQVHDRKVTYFHAEDHGRNVPFTYLAGKQLQYQFMPVLDEDVIDGTVAAHHKALILTSIDYVAPKVAKGLEDFIKLGGLVLMTSDCELKLKGAIDLGVTPALPGPERQEELAEALKPYQEKGGELNGKRVEIGKEIDELKKKSGAAGVAEAEKAQLQKKVEALEAESEKLAKELEALTEEMKPLQEELAGLTMMRGQLAGGWALAQALKPQLEKAGIRPVFESDEKVIVATRQAAGDIEYLFAVNATHDPAGNPQVGLKAADATIRLPNDGRSVYDAVLGGPAKTFAREGSDLVTRFRFGPGQMRVFARTSRPISGIKLGAPILHRDYTVTEAPVRIEFAATLLDSGGRVLSGSAPLRVRLADPLGVIRHDLYRATDCGMIKLSLPLAVNDPPGQWQISIQELLANTTDDATFTLSPVASCAFVAGETRRAVCFGNDAKNVFRLFRMNPDVTIVKGTSAFHSEAADRLARILRPWNVECKVVDAAEVNKGRTITEEAAPTWSGLVHTNRGSIKPGEGNPPKQVGFALRGPAILLGTPEDNPLVSYLATNRYLPYTPEQSSFPGRGRGYLAWQRDAIGVNQESVTLIAYDEAGMSEAVGSLYEAVAGIDPLTPWSFAETHTVAPATEAEVYPEGSVAWQVMLPDAVEGIRWNPRLASNPQGETFQALSHDGTVTAIQAGKAAGKIVGAKVADDPGARRTEMANSEQKPDAAAMKRFTVKGRILKKFIAQGQRQAGAYWGGLVRVMDDEKVTLQRQFQHDIGALAMLGNELVVGLSDGRIVCLNIIDRQPPPSSGSTQPGAFYNAPAPEGAAQRAITIDFNGLPLQQVCKQLTEIAGIPVTCGGTFATRKETTKAESGTLGNVLDAIAKQTGTEVFERYGGYRFRSAR